MYPNNANKRSASRDKSIRNQFSKKKTSRAEMLSYTPYTVRKKINSKFKGFDGIKDEDGETKKIVEPNPICTICKKTINYISEAITSPDGEGYVHFDCALNKAIEQLNPQQNEKVSYVGSGKFAKVRISKNESVFDERLKRKKSIFEFDIVQEVDFETKDSLQKMQTMVEGLRK